MGGSVRVWDDLLFRHWLVVLLLWLWPSWLFSTTAAPASATYATKSRSLTSFDCMCCLPARRAAQRGGSPLQLFPERSHIVETGQESEVELHKLRQMTKSSRTNSTRKLNWIVQTGPERVGRIMQTGKQDMVESWNRGNWTRKCEGKVWQCRCPPPFPDSVLSPHARSPPAPA
jgi:hypothetical protein